jgi:hypothetical protein
MTLKVFGSAQPIYTLGESHCMAFGNTLFEWRTGELFMCRSRFMPTLKAQHYLENGRLNPVLLEALHAERLLDEKNMPRFLDENISFAYYSGVPVMPPPMVFFAGDMDLHMDLFKEWGNDYDFILPGDDIYGFDRSKTPVPIASVCKKVEMLLSPFTNALLQLRDMGFSRMMIHCLPARSNNPKKAHWLGFDYALRAKLTIVANSYYAAFCQRENIGYIDTWAETMENGYLREELDLDGGHLVKSTTIISFGKIMEYLYGNTAHTYNPGRYEIALERSAPQLNARKNTYANIWQTSGIAPCELDGSAVVKLSEGLTFLPPEHALEHLDWACTTSDAREGVLIAQPSLKQLEIAAQLLGSGIGDEALHAGAVGELTISSFRPVRITQEIQGSRPKMPPGARKAIVCLAGKGTLRFSAADGVLMREMVNQPGAFIVYDAGRLSCSYMPLEKHFDIVELTAIPRTPRQLFRVVWAGLKDCPVDPFSYSVAGMLAYPAFTGDRVLERARLPYYDKEREG